MFPFSTKHFLIQTDLTVEQLRDRLVTNVHKWKPISINKDGQLYGTIKRNSAVVELGQSFQRNSFRPIVAFKWVRLDSRTQIKGYYRVARSVLLTTLFIPLAGLYLTIRINNILPFLFLSMIWIIIYMTIGRWLFNKDFKWVEEEFLKLVGKQVGTQQMAWQNAG